MDTAMIDEVVGEELTGEREIAVWRRGLIAIFVTIVVTAIVMRASEEGPAGLLLPLLGFGFIGIYYWRDRIVSRAHLQHYAEFSNSMAPRCR